MTSISKEIPEETKVDVTTMDELSVAFNTQFASGTKLIDGLSKNSLKRVLKVILAYPLLHESFQMTKDDEIQLAQTGVDIQQIKLSMTLESMGIDTKGLAKEVQKEDEEIISETLPGKE